MSFHYNLLNSHYQIRYEEDYVVLLLNKYDIEIVVTDVSGNITNYNLTLNVVRDITYTATSTEYNLKEIDLQTSCGYGNIISFKREVALDILGLPETYIIAVEPVYLKQGEFCYFKSKRGIIYRIENVGGKYQVFDEKSTETQKATKEIMENIKLV